MSKGYLSIVLHSHLPYVRHPEHTFSLEEKWFFEAITECYLPLLNVFNKLDEEGCNYRITFSFSPTLISMLDDPYLQDKYKKYLENLLHLAEKEVKRTQGDQCFHPLALMYQFHFAEMYDLFVHKYNGNILTGFKQLMDNNKLELITCAATHGYLPHLDISKEAVYAQVRLAVEKFREAFGILPPGIWLPECAYRPGIDDILKELGIKYFFTDGHGVTYASPRPAYGVYSPIMTESGVATFGRDPESTKQVWSAEEGYPGDLDYRDFYRDIGYDLDFEYIKNHIHPDGIRLHTGFKYHRITSKGDYKEAYNPEIARSKAEEHAANFMFNREKQIEYLAGGMNRPPLLTAPYDTELFGHWWFEGPTFLYHLAKKIDTLQDTIELATPSDYLQKNLPLQISTPCESSWGDKGYHEVWLNGTNDWIYPHLHQAAETMTELATANIEAEGIKERALNQAARELVLAQASDWPFIMTTGTMVEYAEKRVHDHMVRFNRLTRQISNNSIDEGWLKNLEDADRIFPSLDFRIYQRLSETVPIEESVH